MDIIYKKFNYLHNLEEQRNLFLECFPEQIGKPPALETHYNWKFHSFPAVPESYEFGVFLEKDLIGYYAAIPYKYKIDADLYLSGMVCDVMTGVKSRGKGIFTKLGIYSTDELKKLNIDFTTGYPIRPEVIPGHIKAGWNIIFELPIYIKFLRVNSVLKKFKISFFAPLGNLFFALFNHTIWKCAKKSEYSIYQYSSSELEKIKGYDVFFEQWQKYIPNTLVKDYSFLKWRLSAPDSKYKIVAAYLEENLVGFCVSTKTVLNDIPVIAILDLMVLPQHNDCIDSIIISLEEFAEIEKAEALTGMMSKYQAKRMKLFSIGFLTSPFKFSLIIKKLNDKISDELLNNEKRWHLMWIDSDDL